MLSTDGYFQTVVLSDCNSIMLWKHKITVMENRSLVACSYELETDDYGAEQKRF